MLRHPITLSCHLRAQVWQSKRHPPALLRRWPPGTLPLGCCPVCSSEQMAQQISSLEATYSAVNRQMEKLMARNDALVAERDLLKAKASACAMQPMN